MEIEFKDHNPALCNGQTRFWLKEYLSQIDPSLLAQKHVRRGKKNKKLLIPENLRKPNNHQMRKIVIEASQSGNRGTRAIFKFTQEKYPDYFITTNRIGQVLRHITPQDLERKFASNETIKKIADIALKEDSLSTTEILYRAPKIDPRYLYSRGKIYRTLLNNKYLGHWENGIWKWDKLYIGEKQILKGG